MMRRVNHAGHNRSAMPRNAVRVGPSSRAARAGLGRAVPAGPARAERDPPVRRAAAAPQRPAGRDDQHDHLDQHVLREPAAAHDVRVQGEHPADWTFAPGVKPATSVWGYIQGATCPTTPQDTYLGPVLVNMQGIPTTIKYTNTGPRYVSCGV